MARCSFSFGVVWFCLWWSRCWAVWRYKTNIGDYFIFSTRTTIHLEYEGTSFQEWDAGSFCVVSDKSSPTTTMHCPVPGTHKILPIVRNPTFEDKQRYLSIMLDVNCFIWYIHQETRQLDGIFSEWEEVKAWIFDPEHAEVSELNHTATSPSVYSRTLSKQFWNLGQMPVIVTFHRRITYQVKSLQDGIWIIDVPTISDDIVAHMYGRAVTFQDCFVFDTPFEIATISSTFTAVENDTSVSLPAGSNPIVEWAACVPTTAVLLTDFGVFYTTDGFITSQELRFPPDVVDTALIHSVKEAAVVFRDTFILIDDMVYKIYDDLFYSLEEEENFPQGGIIGLQSRTWCASSYPVDENGLSEVLIWTEDEIYQGFTGDEYKLLVNNFNLKQHLHLQSSVDLLIITACYDSLSSGIIILLECTGCLLTKILYLAAYNEETQRWTLKDFSLSSSTSGIVHMEAIQSAATSMVLWDDDKIYYSFRESKMRSYLKVAGTDKVFSAASEGTAIHQIIIDYSGNTIVKLQNNVLFFLKFEIEDVIKLATWEDERETCAFYFKPSGDMYLLTIKNKKIHRQVYPLKLEVLSAVFPVEEMCPYISFKHNVDFDHYYIDKGQNITFWAQIVFLENVGLSTEFEIYKPQLLKQKRHMYYEIARGICTKNQTITFYHDHDYSEAENYSAEIMVSRGVMTFEVQPSLSGRTCASKGKLVHIRVGCYPNRNLHIENERPEECKPFNFTIPQKYLWDPTGEKDLEILYDVSYSCPIEAHYSVPFRPHLGLYVDKERIGTVESNYVLWEVNGRKDFSYNSTMEQVHCLHEAQSWSMMLKSERNRTSNLTVGLTEEEFFSIWGPHNYYSCFKVEMETGTELTNQYEILNSSGINFIIWPKYHTGIYMFKLRVVDPNFSFCDVIVKFSVRTFGVIERLSYLKIAGWSLLALILILGVLLSSYFRYVKIFQTLSFVDPLQSLHPYLDALESATELKKEE